MSLKKKKKRLQTPFHGSKKKKKGCGGVGERRAEEQGGQSREDIMKDVPFVCPPLISIRKLVSGPATVDSESPYTGRL